MGNALHQVNQNIQRDIRVRVDPKYAHQLQSQSSESSQVQEFQDDRGNFWQKWFRKQQSMNQRKEQQHKDQRGKIPQQQYMKANIQTGTNINTFSQYQYQYLPTHLNPVPQHIFSPQLYNNHPNLKFHWKKLTCSFDLSLTNAFQEPLLRKIVSINQKQIYYTQLNTNLLSGGEEKKILFVEKIVIDEGEMVERMIWNQTGGFPIMTGDSQMYEERLQKMKDINNLIYNWRVCITKNLLKSTDQNSFPIVGLYELSHSMLNLSLKPKFTLFQQLIPYRLSDIRHLTHLQGIYLFQQCLMGFKLLYEIFGYFLIEEQMIGFNLSGKVKVWISSLFWSNLCYGVGKGRNTIVDRNYLMMDERRKYQQQEMVDSIWMIVQKYTLFHSSIVIETGGFRKCTFADALELLIRHKSSIIDRRDKSLGLVRFVDRLEFQPQENHQKQQNLQDKVLTSNIIPTRRIDQQPHNKHITNISNPISVISEPNKQSHINMIPHKTNSPTRRRALIFDRGYSHTMSNNMGSIDLDVREKYSSERSRNQQSTDHVRFINVMSVVK